MITICFTGHRPDKLGGYNWNTKKNQDIMFKISTILMDMLDKNENEQYKFICGGALGIDQMSFHICNKLKGLYDNINIEVAIPFSQQACKWMYEDFKRYETQNSQADKLTYVDRLDNYKIKGYEEEIYYPAKMMQRNMYMVDNSDIVIAVWDGVKKGGTWNCVKYAQKLDKNIIYINPKEI